MKNLSSGAYTMFGVLAGMMAYLAIMIVLALASGNFWSFRPLWLR